MKKILVFALTFLAQLASFAQSNTSKTVAEEFIKYFSANNVDSLYVLFSADMKNAVSASNLNAIIGQIKGQFGNITTSEYTGQVQQHDNYMLIFDKSEQIINLVIDKNDKVVGFRIGANTYKKKESILTPGTVNVKTATSILNGTLSQPEVSQPIPVVLLIAGSGPTDRNGNSGLSSGKPNYFLQISDSLKLKNIAVLRYDKRFVGESTTKKTQAELTFEDMVDDAVAFIKHLQLDKRFSKIIVAGHSEGSLVGMLACQQTKADGFISLAGAGFQIDEIMKTQLTEVLSSKEFKEVSLIIDSIKAGKQIRQKLKPGFEVLFGTSIQPYMYSWMKYDPQKEIAKLKIPVLLVQGTHDIQVSLANAKQLKKAAPMARLRIIEGMSHILKEAPASREANVATYTKSDLALHSQLIPILDEFIKAIK